MTLAQAILIAVVEGITEFLPISSTGHMMITQNILGIPSSDFTKTFIVSIQFGAILSVVVLYWRRFFQSFNFYLKLFVGFLPAAFFGFLLGDFIDSVLENVLVVAVMLILGGGILLKIDDWLVRSKQNREPNFLESFRIGLFQVIAMIPGVSRSAATIVGGMINGLSRKSAAEFSFFLAVPTMFGAACYQLYKNSSVFQPGDFTLLAVGNLVAFVVAAVAIKFFVQYIASHDFKAFGWYRIIIGFAVFFYAI